MEEFPDNRKIQKNDKTEKKIEKVTTNDVIRRKQPLGNRIKESFTGEDSKSVLDYILMDVLLPAAKDTIVDAVTQGTERLVLGTSRSVSRRAAHTPPSGSTGYIGYNRFKTTTSTAPRDELRPTLSRQARSTHNFDEIILATRAEAEEVLTRMYDVLSRYDSVTVSDLYDLVGITGEYTDHNWGWTSLADSSVSRARNGYLLNLPKPSPVE